MKQQPQTQRPMRNLTRRGPRPRRKGRGPALAGDLLAALLAALGGGAERARLSLLWQNWEQVMGPELAPLALPLGHHKDMLLI
uniref:DciA family protein n=1 Tax=Desulfovibrio porci TaxID=2605782 RepID=UPI003A8EA307